MLINYVPGEECRVAIVEDGKLEELHVEKFTSASRVGNIYLAKVSNVEASIQAAFVDFGIPENGFLHVSDLHPRYFPGGDAEDGIEKVGHKTPRRERPAMQDALKRGHEILVQVLKEGVGTKGPTLTSYLSIPGRFLVMMPFMDNVGVSRKVEDEDQRRKMREILDQLDLPEGFGFILRTAGMDRTKTELKRDLAYLMRLWKDMERRLAEGSGKTRLLYSESDLLVRALRDMLTSEIDEVIIDNEQALQRAARFLKIVAPRSSCKLLLHTEKTPLFYAFGVEPQISLMHAREVPLPSGGRLVIDQTEAMVCIDVNSGKSRDARDAEENAFQTNLEAVDEICRQLRLRDLGGIVANDLIDMRDAKNRKEVENRFKERLSRDRAKTTIATISPFGILEMTRQRMRGSHETVHFADCPTCRGRGIIQKPDSVAADAIRELAAVLSHQKIRKVEMVVAPRVASELLSHKRQLLGRLEKLMERHVDVRVSETVPVDRITIYAYDDEGDVDLTRLPLPPRPKNLQEFSFAEDAPDVEDTPVFDAEPQEAVEEVVEDGEVPSAHPIEFDEALPEGGSDGPEQLDGPTLADIGRYDRRGRGRGKARMDRAPAGRDGGRDGGRGGRDGPRTDRREGARDNQRDTQRGGPREGGRESGRGGPRDSQREGQREGGRDRGPRGGQRGEQRGEQRAPAPIVDDADEWGEPIVDPRAGASGTSPDMPNDTGTNMPPNGAMSDQDGQGEGGERRGRRRRRRGRGGRGGEGDGMQGRPDGMGGPAQQRPVPQQNDGSRGGGDWGDEPPALRNTAEPRRPQQQPNVNQPQRMDDDRIVGSAFGRPTGFGKPLGFAEFGDIDGMSGGEGGFDGPMNGSMDGPMDGGQFGEQQGGQDGDGRRRRRGRGGRGGGRGEGGARDARQGQGQNAGRGPSRSPDRGPNRGPDQRFNQPRPNQQQSNPQRADVQRADQPRTAQPRPEQPRVESRPPAAASEAPAPVVRPIQPRSLYGASRRKLNASELNKRPKAE
jgi:ribonuclease E